MVLQTIVIRSKSCSWRRLRGERSVNCMTDNIHAFYSSPTRFFPQCFGAESSLGLKKMDSRRILLPRLIEKLGRIKGYLIRNVSSGIRKT